MSDSDPLDFMAEFAEAQHKQQFTKVITPLAEFHQRIVKGSWALYMEDASQPYAAEQDLYCEVGYIYDNPDFIALAASGTGNFTELVAENDAKYAEGDRFGRWYSKEHPGGELKSRLVGSLFPLTETQAISVRELGFNLPAIFLATDWFSAAMDRWSAELARLEAEAPVYFHCPVCQHMLHAVLTYTGKALVRVFNLEPEDPEPKVGIGPILTDAIGPILHGHWMCSNAECHYQEHIDENIYELIRPDRIEPA